ncbi:hypothetical protein NEHOM01_0606 [Nematocida homosporus]|uniref:uncharacterized protein n=1 Tax=Nematocida homosporus TaxID=1912981 RepID=UPI00221FD838|nr:uncharacterized protein NEHOM01_0606 [Nematocida homosporus]KAI5185101.1 hypothetical protein NEHOM01_0606 [Nematocida homosporus]
MQRALQDITNIKNTNIKITIKREAQALRREILRPYWEYLDTFYRHMDGRLWGRGELKQQYTGEVSLEMRSTLVEWMYEVKTDCLLSSSAFQIGVRLVDGYAMKSLLSRRTFQLLGIVCLYIGQKVADTKRCRASVFVGLCDGAYTKEEFIAMERKVLMEMAFSTNYLLPLQVIKTDYLGVGNALCAFAAEAILLDAEYGSSRPTELAQYIEENVSEIVNGRSGDGSFMTMLREAKGMLDVQPRRIKDAIERSRRPSWSL